MLHNASGMKRKLISFYISQTEKANFRPMCKHKHQHTPVTPTKLTAVRAAFRKSREEEEEGVLIGLPPLLRFDPKEHDLTLGMSC